MRDNKIKAKMSFEKKRRHEGNKMFITNRITEEFSDESLFGEDQLEDLLDKKSQQRTSSNIGESIYMREMNKSSSLL